MPGRRGVGSPGGTNGRGFAASVLTTVNPTMLH